MKHSLTKFLKNTFLTTGLTLTLLACVALLFGGSCIFVKTIFQGLFANACIHLALKLTGKFESEYFMLEAALDITAIIAIALFSALLFDWFSSTPAWVLIIMVLITYIVGSVFRTFRIKDDIHSINETLIERNKNKIK